MQSHLSRSTFHTSIDQINAAIRAGLAVVRRPAPLNVSEWADENFYLSPESSGVSGRWETLPYQRGIMNAFGNDDVRIVSVMKSARVGYTKMMMAACGYFAEHKKRAGLIYQPTDTDASDLVRSEVNPMLRDVPVVGALLPVEPSKKSKHNTDSHKGFLGAPLEILGGKTPRNYRRWTKDYVFYDELSAFDDDIGGEGNPTDLGDVRVTESSFPKSIRGSTPKERGRCKMEASFSAADLQFYYELYCPECGLGEPLKFSQIKCEDKDPATAHYECEHCAAHWQYSQLPELDAAGVWRAAGGEWIGNDDMLRNSEGSIIDWPEHVGFFIWAAYSRTYSWQQLMAQWFRANEERKTGNPGSFRTFVNTRLGETYEVDDSEKIDHHALMARREHYGADVPAPVRYITAWFDVQGDRFEGEIVGWGAGEERWSIRYIRLYGSMDRPEIWAALADMIRRPLRRADGTVMDINLIGMDSGYLPDQVKSWCKRQFGARRAIPTIGRDGWHRPVADYPRRQSRDGVYQTVIGADTAKDIVYARYLIDAPGAGCMHWPRNDDYAEAYFRQAVAERKRQRVSRGRLVWYWDAGGRRNEVLDVNVGNLALIRIAQERHGVDLARSVAATPNGGAETRTNPLLAGMAAGTETRDPYL